MSRNKMICKITALMLSVIMVLGMMPVSALAKTGALPIGASGEITAFEELDGDIVMQSVSLGTSEEDLGLPNALMATVRLTTLEEEPVMDSGEADSEPDSAWVVGTVYGTTPLTTSNVYTVSGSAIGIEEDSKSSKEDEVASPSDAEEAGDSFEVEPTEKTVDSVDEITVALPVTWTSSPEYDGETSGTYLFTPELPEGLTLASGVKAPTITVTVGAAVISGMVTAFDELPDDIRWQNTTTPEFPEAVGGTVEGETTEILVTWEADHDYDTEYPEWGLYVFTAVLGEGYGLAEGVELPRMTVYIPQTAGGRMSRMAGGGTVDSPLEITTTAQLAEIATLVNARENGLELFLFNNADAQVTLELQNDIDLSAYSGGEGWMPIGTYNEDTGESSYFTGIFNGNNHIITGLTINRISGFEQGLFGTISSGGMVKNLGIEDASITGKQYVGGVAGAVDGGGTIQSCFVTGTISGQVSVGGVAGHVGGVVENCYSTGSICGTGYSVGGVVGEVFDGTLQSCYSTCTISGGSDIGGIAGSVDGGTVESCAALNPSVTATGDVGRVAGYVPGGTFSGNIAFGGMNCTSNGSDCDDGTSTTATEIKAAGFFEALFDSDTAWTYAEGKLPGFGAAAPMPAHIVDGSDTDFHGAGTSDNPYQITTAADLAKLAELVNAGTSPYADSERYYKLVNDIDLSGYASGVGWTPIGDTTNSFKGIFDGGGHKITNLTIDCISTDYQGLFGRIGSGGTVKNLGVVNASITGYLYVGGVAGYVDGIVENCYSTGSISGDNAYIGGVAGMVVGTVQNCYSTVSISCDDAYIGGVVGAVVAGTIKNCAALNPSVSGTNYIGRVTGVTYGTLSGNIAFSGMTVIENGSNKTLVEGADQADGLSKTAVEIGTLGFFETLFANDTAWTYAKGKLPGFGTAVDMPDYLIPEGTIPFDGAGTELHPHLIKTAADLAKLAELVNAGISPYADSGRYYKLVNDIDLSGYADGEGWNPIGTDNSYSFKGSFDGNKNTITGLVINRPTVVNIGLFGYLSPNSKVQDFSILGAEVTGESIVGGVAGFAWGTTVENCTVSGSISGTQRVGGVAGYVSSDTTIRNCYSTGSVTGNTYDVGGVVGHVEYETATVQRCYSTANVTGENSVGGVAGAVSRGTIQNCYSTGNVKGSWRVGGVVGAIVSSGSVQDCYSTGNMTGKDENPEYVGGVVGSSSFSSVQNCVALNPSISVGIYDFGRVVGQNSGTLLNNYAFNRIPGTWENKGSHEKDGTDVTLQILFDGSFWTTAANWDTAAWDSSIWTFEDDKLPTLTGLAGQSGDGGLYLTARDIQYASVTPDETSFTYNGSEQRPTLTVTFDGELLVKDTDYTIAVTSKDGSGASAGTNAGEVTLTLTGIGSFSGTKNLTYTIGKKPITITPIFGMSKKYGAYDPLLPFNNDGSLGSGDFDGALARAEGEDVGTYAISLGNLSAVNGNYTLVLASGTVNFTIEQAKVQSINTTVSNVSKTAYDMRDATTAQAVVDAAGLTTTVSVTTDGGTVTLPITWSTSTAHNIKGAEYAVIGTLTGNSNVDTNDVTKSVTIEVTPFLASNTVVSNTRVVINSDSSATAAELGSDILPTSIDTTIMGVRVAYNINWNGGETLDRTAVGNEQTFTGTVSYVAYPAWMTIPAITSASCRVTVMDKTPVTIGGITTANKTYDGTAYVPTGTVTVTGGSVPAGQLEWLYESTDGAGYSDTAAPADAGDYKLTLSVPKNNPNYRGREEFTFTIKKREITLTANNKTVIKGDSLPELTYTVGNLADDEISANALSTAPTLACPTFEGNTPGDYEITLTGGMATDNYTITTRTNGILTVAEQTYTVTFNLNGGMRTGGGELTQTVVEGGAATAPTVVRSGYNFTGWDKAFNYVTSNLTVTAGWRRKSTVKTPVTIGGITTANKTYDGTAYVPTGTVTVTGGSVPAGQLEWLYESTDGAGYSDTAAPADAGDYKLTLSVPKNNPNYTGSEEFTFTIEKREITLTANNKTVIKGDSLPELTYTVGNLADDEISANALSTAPTLVCPTFEGNTPGDYEITLTGGMATDNYTITTRTNGILTVAEQTYTVTFNLDGGMRTGGGELTQTVVEGGAATAPTVVRSGYNFTGWDKAFNYVTSNLTVTAGWSHTGGGGGGGGGSSDDNGSSSVIVTPPAPNQPNAPTQCEIKVETQVSNGNAAVTITEKTVKNAYEKALAEAKKNGNEQNGITLVLKVDTGNQTINSVTFSLSKEVQEFILSKKIVNTVVAMEDLGITIGMDLAAVWEINRQANADVNITATRMDNSRLTGSAKAAIGSRLVFDLKVSYGNGKAVQNFGAGSIAVEIPYHLDVNEQADNIQAVYVDKDGKVQWLLSSVYDSVNEVLRFATSHFSTYGVGYKQNAPVFTDIGGHWAKDDIAFVVNRGLFSGISKTTFSPNTAMTRGMFVTAIGRLANADVATYKQSSFTDVKNDAYYMGYIEWASKNNIVNGVGNKKFAPDQSITREQMAVIMSNYAGTIGYTLPKVHVKNTFADHVKISAYAKDAVKQMQMAGIVSGKNGNLFDSQGTATRAEVSAVLRRFVELAISSDTVQGWTMNDSGRWMYFEDGKPVTGKKDVDGSTYTFDRYGVTVDVPKNLRYTTYIVQRGDSFWRIAHKLGCKMRELERLNNKSRFSLIFPSDTLRVPEK